MNNEIPVLFANCVLVKGFTQCILCDLQRNSYVVIPNGLYEILTKLKGKSIAEIKYFYENKFNETIDEYFEILISNDFIFLTNTPELFPDLEMEWDEPFTISNAILDIGMNSTYNLDKALDNLNSLNCKFVQLRIYKKFCITEMEVILRKFENIDKKPIGIEFCLNYDESFTPKETRNLFQRFTKLNTIAFYTSPSDKNIETIEEGAKYIVHQKSILESEKKCGIININSFAINTKMFSESMKFNSCLNRKVSIDVDGNIKNCPSMPRDFGNIKNTSLQEAIDKTDFKKYWNVTKDQIEVCKDCEFRYICTDCRAYIEKPNVENSKPLKCGYNPYSGKWEDWSNSTLKTKAIKHYSLQDLINKNE